jgi:hypothetical protein
MVLRRPRSGAQVLERPSAGLAAGLETHRHDLGLCRALDLAVIRPPVQDQGTNR